MEDFNKVELAVSADIGQLERINGFVEQMLDHHGFSVAENIQVQIAVEEVFVNIVHYAYAPGTGNATIIAAVEENPKRAIITFVDSGVPYNPLERKDPDVTLPIEKREIGGLGIFMVKKSMDEVSYRYEDGKNILTIIKKKD